MANWQLHFSKSNKIRLTSDLRIAMIAICSCRALFVCVCENHQELNFQLLHLHILATKATKVDIQKPLHSLLKIDVGIVIKIIRICRWPNIKTADVVYQLSSIENHQIIVEIKLVRLL